MALANLGELRGEVADTLARPASDIVSEFPNAVAKFEARFNRTARVAEMETAAAITLSGGVAALPTDFIELRNVVDSGGNTFGSYYLSGFSLVFPSADPNDADISVVNVLYYARLPALVADTDTNWLLTLHPDLYVNGVIRELGPWLVDPTVLQVYETLYQQGIAELKSSDIGKRWGGLQVVVQGPTP